MCARVRGRPFREGGRPRTQRPAGGRWRGHTLRSAAGAGAGGSAAAAAGGVGGGGGGGLLGSAGDTWCDHNNPSR